MVKVCPYNFSSKYHETYCKFFCNYSYTLYDFQKWSIKGIVDGNHVLVCAPTGSGKTLPGEFAIEYFHSKGKKIIYTTPIKALSNEKFHNFTEKYPTISIGLITGDIKNNPDADVLVMTTEILMNKLYQMKCSTIDVFTSSVSFDMDIENELGCVVFDEIHMINDEHRGHVWEQCIMLLPSHIQIIGLSATLDNPEKFAFWLENKGDLTKPIEKEVYLTHKQVRAVPLIHYSFFTAPSSINKYIKDKTLQEEIKHLTNKPLVIQDEKNIFNNVNYKNMNKIIKIFQKFDIRVKRQNVLNKLAEYMVEKEMLPALCYVFSRKQLEICANEITTNLLEFDSKIPYTIDRECEQIIRKLPNYKEYLYLPEYINTIKLMRKGIGIHHAGLMPVLREMTELLFAKGFIKILFCTETMSVGINLPVKTTIFTDINKFNGDIVRTLYSHEYTQAAGRAGRLGLDLVGHVIHLNNLFRDVDFVMYKNMMSGKPQTLTSKFKISYNLLLNLLNIGDKNLINFANKSMINEDLGKVMREIYLKISKIQSEIDNDNIFIKSLKTPLEAIDEIILLKEKLNLTFNKKKKEVEKKINILNDNFKFINQDMISYLKIREKKTNLQVLKCDYDNLQNYFQIEISNVLELLIDEGFICGDVNKPDSLIITYHGKIASQFKEIHCLAFSKLYLSKKLDNLTSKQLIMLFSCFTNIKVNDEIKNYFPDSKDDMVNLIVKDVSDLFNYYYYKEVGKNIKSGLDYYIHYDLLIYLDKWCNCETVEDCKLVIQELREKKQIFLGEFIKALLKINNIASEMEQISEMTGNVAFLSKIKEIGHLTLKYVVTNQSLYV